MNEHLLRKARKGDPDAFSELMREQLPSLYRTAKAIVYSDADAADAIQETLLACWQKLSQVREEGAFRSWLMRILIRKCQDQLRRREYPVDRDSWPETGADDTSLENIEWVECLRSLDEKVRLVMQLYYIDGFSSREIGEIMNIPASTVRSRLSEGRKQLSRGWKEEKHG